ncbi:hypothetical protein pqer_cds_9 [Pandoravirus quercus]|uniref:Uncharacterized protein n=1 Tax=Pandoravirus quercus TaxID=2107709 RepID=A0A2U7U7N0_9VIRU|nr:hypothetical protein pqer_cds_9 [Pandoravirus quercus]AVK74431.1 hypothetical protein pqer_cds_9 [Pandoravirus quercus]
MKKKARRLRPLFVSLDLVAPVFFWVPPFFCLSPRSLFFSTERANGARPAIGAASIRSKKKCGVRSCYAARKKKREGRKEGTPLLRGCVLLGLCRPAALALLASSSGRRPLCASTPKRCCYRCCCRLDGCGYAAVAGAISARQTGCSRRLAHAEVGGGCTGRYADRPTAKHTRQARPNIDARRKGHKPARPPTGKNREKKSKSKEAMLSADDARCRMETVQRERRKGGSRAALYGALHDLHRHYVAAARRTDGAGSATADAPPYQSFGELCTRELNVDRQSVQRSIKDVLVGRLLCGIVAGQFGEHPVGQAASDREADMALAESVPPSAYRCLVTLVNEHRARDNWIDDSREALAAWFAASDRRGLRRTFASVWARAKAVAGPGVRPARQHFVAAYSQERASPVDLLACTSSLGKRKRQATSSPSAQSTAEPSRAPCPCAVVDGDRVSREDAGRWMIIDGDNEHSNSEDEEEDDDDDDADHTSHAEVCHTGDGSTDRPLPTPTSPSFEARYPPLGSHCSAATETIVVTDALGRQYTLTPLVSSPSSRTPPTRHEFRTHTGHERSTTTPPMSVPVGRTTAVTSVVPIPTTTTVASVQASSTHQKASSLHQHHQAATPLSSSSSSTEEDAEALRLEAALAQCARAVQRECIGAPSDARSTGAVDGGPPSTTTATTTTTTTTTTASATSKRDLFDAISACMRYVADKTPAPEGESAPTAADWLRASCAEDARPDESATMSAAAPSEPERRQRWHARRMLVGCLRAMAMLGDPCFAMAVVASLGDDLAQRRQQQQQQQQILDIEVSPPPE